jgi:hypothetical protein
MVSAALGGGAMIGVGGGGVGGFAEGEMGGSPGGNFGLSCLIPASNAASTSALGVAYFAYEAATTCRRRLSDSTGSGNSGFRSFKVKSKSLRSTRPIAWNFSNFFR